MNPIAMSVESNSEPLRFPRGEACRILATLTVPNDDGITDITGMAIRLRIRDSSGTLITALTKTVGSGVTIVSATVFRVDFTSAETVSLVAGIYHYDVFRTDSGSESEWIRSSPIKVVKTVNFG